MIPGCTVAAVHSSSFVPWCAQILKHGWIGNPTKPTLHIGFVNMGRTSGLSERSLISARSVPTNEASAPTGQVFGGVPVLFESIVFGGC